MFNPNYETLALYFTESHEEKPLNVLQHFQNLRTENETITRTWNIEPGSEKPSLMKWVALDKRNQERLIFMAPGFSIKVAGPAFQGGVVASKAKDNTYYIAIFNLKERTVIEVPPVGEEMLIAFLNNLINGNPRKAA